MIIKSVLAPGYPRPVRRSSAGPTPVHMFRETGIKTLYILPLLNIGFSEISPLPVFQTLWLHFVCLLISECQFYTLFAHRTVPTNFITITFFETFFYKYLSPILIRPVARQLALSTDFITISFFGIQFLKNTFHCF